MDKETTHFENLLSKVATVVQLYVALTSLGTLLGWVFGISYLLAFVGQGATTHPVTAIGLLVLVYSLRNPSSYVGAYLSVGLGVLSLFYTLVQGDGFIYISGIGSKVAPLTSVGFVLMGLAHILRISKKFVFSSTSYVLVLAISTSSLLGYLVGDRSWVPGIYEMSLPTATNFFLVSIYSTASYWIRSRNEYKGFHYIVPFASLSIVLAFSIALLSSGVKTSLVFVLFSFGSALSIAVGISIFYIQRVSAQASEAESSLKKIKSMRSRLEHMVHIDPLTKALNRAGLANALDQLHGLVTASPQRGWSLLLDLDGFKKLNNLLGTAGGDRVLRDTAECLRSVMGRPAWVSRIGGDEFLVLFLANNLAQAELMCTAFTSRLSEKVIRQEEHELPITASAALIELTPDITSIDDLIRLSSPHLLKAKASGKNRVVIGTPYDYPGSETEESLLDPSLYYAVVQPIVDLNTREVIGGEYLVRHKVFTNPDILFRSASSAGILNKVDLIALDTCIGAAKKEGLMHASVNLYPATFGSLTEEFLSSLEGMNVCLELSEKQVLESYSNYIDVRNTARKYGIKLAMDDLGSGYASINAVIVLAPDVVKLDRIWVENVSSTPWKKERLSRLVAAVDSQGAYCIAEGVNSEEDIKVLLSLGVTLGQGYYLGFPHQIKP